MRIRYAFACGLTAWAGLAAAQYKYVGPDGRTTYSDRPPPANERVVDQKRLGSNIATPSALPFELQQASTRFPVTLYTGERCAPCDEGRSYLRNRGIPFAEKTVKSDEDIDVFKRQSPDGTAPLLVVGGRKLTGFATSSWGSLLDDAGYPTASKLPRDYQNSAPESASPNTKTAAQNVVKPVAPGTAPTPPRGASVPGSIPSAPPATPNAASAPPGFRF